MSLQNSPIMVPGSQVEQPVIEVNSICSQADTTCYSSDKSVMQFCQVFSNNVGTSVTLNTTATSQAVWNLSGDTVWNFGRSYMTFQMNFTAPGANLFTNVNADIVPIDSVILQTVSGSQLGVLYNFQPYSRIAPALTTSLKNYLSAGACYGGTTPANSLYTENTYLQPINCLFSVAGSGGGLPSASYIYSTAAASTVAIGSALAAISVDSGTDKSYQARQRVIQRGTVNSALQILCRVNFNKFVGTILSVDKNFLIGQNLQLIINFSAVNQFAFNTAAIIEDGAMGTQPSVPTSTVTLTNLYVWMGKELNGNLVNSLRQKLAQGYVCQIPYTYCGRTSTGAAGLFSSTQTLSQGMGLSLKRIVNIVQTQTSTSGLLNDLNNVNGAQYTTVQSYLDANPIQQARLLCGTDIQDWQYLQPLLDNTSLGLSVREYQVNPCWVDNFASSLENGGLILENDCVDDGLKVAEASKLYSVQYTLTKQFGSNVNQYLTWVRRLMISPAGIYWQ